jgi:hypothetical protein
VISEDAKTYRTEVLRILRSNGLDWVAQQVQETILGGKQFSKEILEPALPQYAVEVSTVDEAPPRRRRKTKRTSTSPLSDEEQLSILIDAIERALVDRSEFQNAIFEILHDVDQVTFAPDIDDIDLTAGAEHAIGYGVRDAANGLTQTVRPLLSALRVLLDGY